MKTARITVIANPATPASGPSLAARLINALNAYGEGKSVNVRIHPDEVVLLNEINPQFWCRVRHIQHAS